MGKTFFTADTHFGHGNIIAYENRPFGDAAEMDSELIRLWNETVSDGDTVYMLGDFSFYGKEETAAICKQLRGRKLLVRGNHDNHSNQWYRDCGFAEVYDIPVIFAGFWMLSHEPLYINTNMPYGNIFGHVHSNPTYADASSNSCCVSVERTGYAPIEFDEVKRRMGLI